MDDPWVPLVRTSCRTCTRGRESCQYCESVSKEDWEAMCDCGLYDFGQHLVDCMERSEFKYVIAGDYDSAMFPRPGEDE